MACRRDEWVLLSREIINRRKGRGDVSPAQRHHWPLAHTSVATGPAALTCLRLTARIPAAIQKGSKFCLCHLRLTFYAVQSSPEQPS